MYKKLILVIYLTLFSAIPLTEAWMNSRKNNLRLANILSSKKISAGILSFALISSPVLAFGPVEIKLSNIKYKPVELCNGKKPIMPGQKAMEGIKTTNSF